MMKLPSLVIGVSLIVLGLLVLLIFWTTKPAIAPSPQSNTNSRPSTKTNSADQPTTTFSTVDLPDRDWHFSFTLAIPGRWTVDYDAPAKAVVIYDPTVGRGGTTLDTARIFITYYQADDFQPLSSYRLVTSETIGGQPARWYQYQPPNNVRFAPAPGYPSWVVAEAHRAVHVKTVGGRPYTFYVMHQSPDLVDETFKAVVKTLNLGTERSTGAGRTTAAFTGSQPPRPSPTSPSSG